MPIPSANTSSHPDITIVLEALGVTPCDEGNCTNPKHSAKSETTACDSIVAQHNSIHPSRPKETQHPKIQSLMARSHDELWVDISDKRLPNSCLGALYPGSKFKGHQKCGRTSYEVVVDIQHVDVKESTLSGYLNIKGLTAEFPELTTFFVGEIIGPKYSFLTRKWQAKQSIDLDHWTRLSSFQPNSNMFSDSDFVYDPMDNDYVYMRWKELFLVPDHHVSSIDGASFAGFYYICYQRSAGKISGLYFFLEHKEKYQELSLLHEPQRSFGNYEFC